MRFLSTDLFRNFGVGFVLGAVLVVAANAEDWGAAGAPAQAAEMQTSIPAPSAEFVIAPQKG